MDRGCQDQSVQLCSPNMSFHCPQPESFDSGRNTSMDSEDHTVSISRLIWTLAVCISDKDPFLMTCPICVLAHIVHLTLHYNSMTGQRKSFTHK